MGLDDPKRGPDPDALTRDEQEAAARRRAAAEAEAADARKGPEDGGAAPFQLPPRIDRYVLLRQLGAGGMGSVYLAYDEALSRKVAIKLLNPQVRESESVRLRMEREAQALAQISHPNVVQIHDVGRVGARVFVAMEYIEGQTLRGWMRARARDWRESLEVLLQAGEGLAAAHQVGIVHRDVKPDNILVGDDGRVRVADFGLARADHLSAEVAVEVGPELEDDFEGGDDERSSERIVGGSGVGPSSAGHHPSGSPLYSPLTVAGTLLGTPAYMAPEQHMRRVADARADIFSFCVVAHEVLVGKRPFEGPSRAELVRAIYTGHVDPPPRESKVPTWILKALRGGLSAEPEERPPTMQALLAALRRDPARRRRRIAQGVGLGAVILVAGAVGAELRPERVQPCDVVYQEVAALWGPERQEAVQRALSAHGGALGPATWERVGPALSTYVSRLYDLHEGACREHREGRISDALHDRTMECLERPRAEVHALGELLAAADQEVTERAVDAVHRLPDLDACADVGRLLARVAPPADPGTAAAVRELRERLDRIRASRRLGSFAAAADASAKAVHVSASIEYAPVRGEALAEEGAALIELGKHAIAAERYAEALRLAEASGDDELRLTALSGVLAAHAATSAPIEVIAFLAPQALALVDRQRVRGQSVHGRLLVGLGETYLNRSDNERAARTLEEAAAIFTELGDAGLADLSAAYNDLAMIRSMQGRYDDAHALYQRAAAALIAALGPGHPYVGHLLNNEGRAYEKEGDLATARARYERALMVWEPVYGRDHEPLEVVTGHLARVTLALGDLDAAEGYARRSLELRESRPPERSKTDAVLMILAKIAERRGDLAAAEGLARRALAAMEVRYGDRSTRLVEPLRLLAGLALERGEADAAVLAAERARELVGDGEGAAEIGLLCARARWEQGDLRLAHDAATAARAAAGGETAAIDAWLASHPITSRR
ncbi:MAG: protein kinase [Nannocystaceae bacterium]